MSRIGKAYEARFRALLLRLRARKLESGITWLMDKAKQDNRATALTDRYEHLRSQVRTWELHTQNHERLKDLRFVCDAGLGGLARWLRAAGFEAFWFPDIEDTDLLRQAERLQGIVLTTDSLMMERGVLRDG